LSAQQLPTNAAAPANTPASPSNHGLRPDHVAAEAGVSSLVPLYLQPRFLAIPSLLALGFAGACFRLRRASDPGATRRTRERGSSKATHRVMKELEAAALAGDAARFFTLARSALLRTFDGQLGAESEEIRQIFALADEANYSGHQLTTTDFERWTHIVRHRLLDEHHRLLDEKSS
jgi:hypothetical protein